MPLPAERTVTGKYVNPVTGEPYNGTDGSHYVIFEPVPDRWIDQDGNQVLVGGGQVNLAVDGTFNETVVCTDSAGVLPVDGRLWRLRQYVGGAWATQYLAVPTGDSSLDITDLLSVDLSGVEYVPVPGPRGEQGLTGATGPQGQPGLAGGLDTGITFGGSLSPNVTNPLAVDIAPLTGRMVDYATDPPTVTQVESSVTLTVELDSVAQQRSITWLLMDADLNVFQQEARPSSDDRRNLLVLGVVLQDGGSVVLTQSIPTVIEQPVNQLYDLLDAIGAFNMSGNAISPNGANLMLDQAPGQVFSRGWSYWDGFSRTTHPHIASTLGAHPASWVHVLRDTGITPSAATSTVDVGHYDEAGVLTAATGAVVHQLWTFPASGGSEIRVLQYGQQQFATLADAVQQASSTPIAVNPALPGNAVRLAYLAVLPTATDLSDLAQAQVIPASTFGGGSGGGGGGGGDLSNYALLTGAEFTGSVGEVLGASDGTAEYSRATADTANRYRRLADGTQQWGDGTASPDAMLRRLAAGVMAFLNTDLQVGQDGANTVRLRQAGSDLGVEASGADLLLSVYELADFSGTQRAYLRLEVASQLAHALGTWIFSATPDGAAVHTLDAAGDMLGFHGASPVARQTVSGERSTGAALQAALQALDRVGLISDTSTAGPEMVQTVNNLSGPNVTLGAADVSAVPVADKGVAGGVATLGADGKVPGAQLPASSVTSVNNKSGDVNLTAADVNAVPVADKGVAGGVATLDTGGKVPSSQLPPAPVTSVNNLQGDVVLNAASVGALTQANADGRYVRQDALVFNVKEHGAVGDGAADDLNAIQNLLSTSPAGSTVLLPPGTYGISAPIVVPPGKVLRGQRANLMGVTGLYDPQVCIKPLAGFTGVAAIRFLSQADGGYSAISGEQRVVDIMLDGSNLTAGVDGIQAKGNVQNVALRDVTVRKFPNSGIYCGLDGSNAAPYSWRMHRVMLDSNQAHGMYAERMVDLTMEDCQAIGNWATGWTLLNAANGQLSACRAEWSGTHGYYLSGDWGSGQGAGGLVMSGCSTDRNGYHGIYIDATGTPPIVISGLVTRRDGRNGGSGGAGYAGLGISGATTPVVVGDWANYPGVDDDNTGANSPQYGASVANATHVQIDNAYLHADAAGLNNGGGNTVLQLGANVTFATGGTTSPSRAVQALDASRIGSGVLASARIPDLSGSYLATSQKGAAGGVASLDSAGRLSAGQLAWRRRDLPDPVVADSLYTGAAPTISVAQTSTPNTGYVKYAPPGVALSGTDQTGNFTYLGATNFQIGTGTPDSSYVLPTSRYPWTRGNLTSSQSVWSVQFGTNAQVIQVRFNYQTAGVYRLNIDGRKVADLMTAMGGTTAGNSHLMTIDFGSAAPRVIKLDFSTVPFGGVFLPPTANLWAAPSRSDRFMAFGDSLSDGSNINTGGGAGTWAHRAARLLGSNDCWDEARGGTGYITAGSYATLGDRVQNDVVGNSPSRLVVWAGYNDNTGSQTSIRSAADSLYSAIKSGLPRCETYVIGCWSPKSSPAASIQNTDETLRAAAAAAGFPFISPLTGSCYDRAGTLVATHGPWITGTGNTGATTGSGNADIYIGSDAVHPTDAGHVYLSRRIAQAIRELMPA